ncbi:hypothetical protein Tco_1314697 [Tanacetum coccineum]
MLTYGVTNNNVTYINAVSYDHLENETPQNKGVIKSPSKLLSLKYQSQLSLVEQDMNSSSPKLVYLVNTITIVKKEDEPREPETSKLSEIGHDGSSLVKDLSDESIEPKKVTNDEGLSNLGDKECKDGVEKDNEWIEYEEPLDLVNLYDESIYESIIEEMPRKHRWMTFTDGSREVTFKTPYKDPERSELTTKGHDLLSFRIILSEDDYDRRCEGPSDLDSGFYKGCLELALEYQTGPGESSSGSDVNNQGGVM